MGSSSSGTSGSTCGASSTARRSLLQVASFVDAAEHAVRRLEDNRQRMPQAQAAVLITADVKKLLAAVEERLNDPQRTADIGALEGEVKAQGVAMRDARVRLGDAFVQEMQRQRQAYAVQLRARLAVVCAVLALTAYLSMATYLVMQGGLDVVTRRLQHMAAGDLSAPNPPHGLDEVATMLTTLAKANNGLSDLLASVREGVAAFRQASNQVAEGNGKLAVQSRSMADSLDVLVSGVAEYNAQLEACGQQVALAAQSVQRLRLDAVRHREQVARVEERMQALVAKTREIGQIVRLIDAIAFRTNVLALNASIEASKAGNEVGRGFAVVAMEVRSLAQRTASSAQRISVIVAGSSEDFALASELVSETSRSMAESDRHVDEIHGAIGQVSSLTAEGTRRAARFADGVRLAEHNTRHNQVLVEQLASASAALRVQGERLSQKIGRFTLS